MRCGHDRDGLFGDIDAELEALAIDVVETVNDKRRRFVGDIQQHVIRPSAFHFAVNRARHNIARRQTGHRMGLIHKFAPGQILQHRPPAQCLANKKDLALG